MIRELREQLAADLQVIGVPVLDTWPDRVSPPVAFLTPATGSYVTGGPTFGQIFTVAVDVVLLVKQGSGNVALAALEELIEAVLVNTVDWQLAGVDSPSLVSLNGAEHLGTIVHLSKSARLN